MPLHQHVRVVPPVLCLCRDWRTRRAAAPVLEQSSSKLQPQGAINFTPPPCSLSTWTVATGYCATSGACTTPQNFSSLLQQQHHQDTIASAALARRDLFPPGLEARLSSGVQGNCGGGRRVTHFGFAWWAYHRAGRTSCHLWCNSSWLLLHSCPPW